MSFFPSLFIYDDQKRTDIWTVIKEVISLILTVQGDEMSREIIYLLFGSKTELVICKKYVLI